MRRKSAMLASLGLIALTGCAGPAPIAHYQRFVLVPDTTKIGDHIPPGGLALDTKTGQLCYTVGGPYTSGFPAIDMCTVLYQLTRTKRDEAKSPMWSPNLKAQRGCRGWRGLGFEVRFGTHQFVR